MDHGANRAENGARAADEDGLDGAVLTDRVGTPPTILVVDNYDSFAYNLVQYVGGVLTRMGGGEENLVVRRNDEVDLAAVRALDPDGIVVSPGPGTPAEAGVSVPIFAELRYPTLGVCLGHQALCAANSAPVERADAVVHGKPSTITHDGEGVFESLPNPIEAGRYHSLGVARDAVPDDLVVTAHAGTPATDGDSEANRGDSGSSSGGSESSSGDSGSGDGDSGSGDGDSDRDRSRTDGHETIPEADLAMAVRHRERPHVGLQFHPESILTDDGQRLVATFCLQCSTT